MRVFPLLLAGLMVTFISEASAADVSVPALQYENYQPASYGPTFSVVGSLSGLWTNNALFSRNNRRDDVFFEPDITFRLDGRFTEDWSWRVYARGEFEAFSRVKDADAAFALFGARLTRADIAGWSASLIYENRHEFGGIFDDRLFTAHDFKIAASRSFVANDLIFSPFIQARYRTSDLVETWRYRLDIVLGIEAKINDRWSVVSTPFFEAFWFESGLNDGRRDQIYSVSLGLKYNIASNIALTTSAAFEERRSNVPLRHYRDWTIGPRLDFAF